MDKKVLMVNKDVNEATCFKKAMESSDTNVTIATTIPDALQQFSSEDLCLVVFNLNMTIEFEQNRLNAVHKLKSLPLMVLSSQTCQIERLKAFQGGAHTYMGKPYSLTECIAQAHALMQLYLEHAPERKAGNTLVSGGNLVIDSNTRQVFLKGKKVNFTRKEFDILFCLASNPGQVFTREQLYNHIWGEESAYSVDDVVKTHIKTLRHKLSEANWTYIQNVWGIGYRFCNEGED